MTHLLQRSIVELEKLPSDTQDAIATRLLAELAEEQAWDAQFAATTDAQWDRLAEMVRQDIATGNTMALDAVFPPDAATP